MATEITDFTPTIMCTGGLESVVATCADAGEHEHALGCASVATDIAGCIDAPESMPAGSMRSGNFQTYARRSQAT